MTEKKYLKHALEALVTYGYEMQPDGSVVRFKGSAMIGFVPRDQWTPDPEGSDGLLRFTRADGVWQPVPYTVSERFAQVSGLSHLTTPECFDYVYPAEYVLHIYEVGVEEKRAALAEHEAKRAALAEHEAKRAKVAT